MALDPILWGVGFTLVGPGGAVSCDCRADRGKDLSIVACRTGGLDLGEVDFGRRQFRGEPGHCPQHEDKQGQEAKHDTHAEQQELEAL
jgi:hypothetical protein